MRLTNEAFNLLVGRGEFFTDPLASVSFAELAGVTARGNADADTIKYAAWIPSHFYEYTTEYGLYVPGVSPAPGSRARAAELWVAAVHFFGRGLRTHAREDYGWAYYYLGHAMHLLQDASVPAHVRNDCHASGIFQWICDRLGARGGGDGYEEFSDHRAPSLSFGEVAPRRGTSLSDLWGPAGTATGLAQETGRNFLSDHTIFAKEDGTCGYALPAPPPDFSSPEFQVEAVPGGRQVYLRRLTLGNPIHLARLTLVGLQWFRAGHTPRNCYLWSVTMELRDDRIYEDYYRLLAPRAVSHSAGLILLLYRDAVRPLLTTLRVTADPQELFVGDSTVLTATGFDASGNLLPVDPEWTASPGDAGSFSATVGRRVVFAAATFGEIIITARQESKSASTTLLVRPILSRIVVSPVTASRAIGETVTLTATGFDARNSPVPISPSWTVTGGIGMLSSGVGTSVVFTATAVGRGTVQATDQGVVGTATIEVTAPAEAFDLRKITQGTNISFIGLAETPDNGLLHALWFEYERVPGSPPCDSSTVVNTRIQHAVSANQGATWTVRTAPIPSYFEIQSARVVASRKRLHLFYSSRTVPQGPFQRPTARVVNPGSGTPTIVTVGYTYHSTRVAPPDAYPESTNSCGEAFGVQVGQTGAFVSIDVQASPEPNVTHIHVWVSARPVGTAYAQRLLAATVENRTQTVVVSTSAPAVTFLNVSRRSAHLYARTAEDGITWELPVSEVDRDSIPSLEGALGTRPPHQRIGLLEDDLALAVDEAGNPHFAYVFDGVDPDEVQGFFSDSPLEAVYYKRIPGQIREAIVRYADAAANGQHFRGVAVTAGSGRVLALYREIKINDELRWAVRNGSWGPSEAVHVDGMGRYAESWQLTPAGDRLLLLLVESQDGQSMPRLYSNAFTLTTTQWGGFDPIADDVPNAFYLQGRPAPSLLPGSGLRTFFSVGTSRLAAQQVWLNKSELHRSLPILDTSSPPLLDPPVAPDDRLYVLSSPPSIAGGTAYVALAHVQGAAQTFYLGRMRNVR